MKARAPASFFGCIERPRQFRARGIGPRAPKETKSVRVVLRPRVGVPLFLSGRPAEGNVLPPLDRAGAARGLPPALARSSAAILPLPVIATCGETVNNLLRSVQLNPIGHRPSAVSACKIQI